MVVEDELNCVLTPVTSGKEKQIWSKAITRELQVGQGALGFTLHLPQRMVNVKSKLLTSVCSEAPRAVSPGNP